MVVNNETYSYTPCSLRFVLFHSDNLRLFIQRSLLSYIFFNLYFSFDSITVHQS